jgi:hypothetical protein
MAKSRRNNRSGRSGQRQQQHGGNLEVSAETMAQAKSIAEGLLQNLANSQKGGGEVSAYESENGLHGSPLSQQSGGIRSRSRASRRGGSKSSRRQRGGMMPGVMSAVETALVPLGLYLGQKALQSRSGKGKGSYKSFRNKFSRRNRK